MYCILYLILKKILDSKTLKSMTRRSISLKCFSPESPKPMYIMKHVFHGKYRDKLQPQRSLYIFLSIYAVGTFFGQNRQVPNTKQMHNEFMLK